MARKGERRRSEGQASYVVVGRVRGGNLASLAGVEAAVLDFRVGGSVELANRRLGDDGTFELTFDGGINGKDLPDLLVQVRAGERVLANSAVRLDAKPGRVVIDVDLPADVRAGRSEYESLIDRLQAAGTPNVAAVDAKRQPKDLAYLAGKTGWDARAVAMVIVAQRLSERTRGSAQLDAEYFYALFRSGVQGTEEAVLRVPAVTARSVWKAASDDGVIAHKSVEELTNAESRFEVLVTNTVLKTPGAPGASTLAEVLAVSFGDDTAATSELVRLLAQRGDDPQAFWRAVEGRFGAAARQRLQLDSELAALTFENAGLMRALRADALPQTAVSLEALAMDGYARPEAWARILEGLPVPAQIEADTPEKRRARYAQVLAAQVRLAFPVAALAHRIETGVVPLNPRVQSAVVGFLKRHRGKYRLGEEPLERYLARNRVAIGKGVRAEIRKLERVYQLTPSDEAMDALLEAGLHSAYQIAQLDERRFVAQYERKLGSPEIAMLVHAKAREIHTATVNVVVAFQTSRAGITIGNPNAPLVQTEISKQALSQANASAAATLETLFGELDYCACEHCRSVLSPAAYLVDLLMLCDPDDAPPAGMRRPMDELRRRRPDLEHLPLTCANTHTPLPVIDMVNETLEYFVVAAPIENLAKPAMSLDDFRGYSTLADVSPQDLLTEPQNVRAAAYAGLRAARFPLALPFNEPLEAVRRYLAALDRTLAGDMEALRINDDLDRGAAVAYGWRDILMEELQLSREQHAILTDRSITVRELYGFPAAGAGEPAVPLELRNAKQFARRLGLSYEDVTTLLRTRFINPNAWVLPLAERLGVTLAQMKQFVATANTRFNNTAFETLVSAGLDPAVYGGSIAAWVRVNAPSILGLLTLHDPSPQPDPCNFDMMEFRYGDPAANGGAVRDIEFVRLIRFVRLWKNLAWPSAGNVGADEEPSRGWSIAETDAALTALYPVDQLPLSGNDATDLQRLDEGLKGALLRLGALQRVMRRLEVRDRAELPAVLACFAPMQGIEDSSLYRRLFMSTEFLRLYPSFLPDAAAQPIPQAAVTLASQSEALSAACGLTSEEWNAVVQPPSFPANAPLAFAPTAVELQAMLGHVPTAQESEYLARFLRTETVSAVFRRAWLSRALRLSPRELNLLARATGLDPFADLSIVVPATPPNPSEAFIQLVLDLRASGLAPAEALLAFFNQDLLAASAASQATAFAFASTLRADLADVDRALVVTDDPDSVLAQTLLASVYGADVADRYLAYINRKARVDVTYLAPGGALPGGVLPQVVLQASDGGLEYDDFSQRLSYTKGVMPAAVRDRLIAPALAQAQAFTDAVQALFAQTRVFLQQLSPAALQQAHDVFVASAAAEPVKRKQLLADLIAALKPLRKRQAALDRTTAALRITGQWPMLALTDSSALSTARDVNQAGVADLLAVDVRGVVGQFFFGNLAPVPDVVDPSAGALDYQVASGRNLPANAPNPGQPIACRWLGFLRAPAPGTFNLFIETDAGAPLPVLTLEGSPVALQAVSAGVWRTAASQVFDGGRLVAFTLEATGVTGRAALLWQTAGAPRVAVPADELYSFEAMQDLISTVGRLQRAEMLRTKWQLSEAELLHLLRMPDLSVAVSGVQWPWLATLPIVEPPAPQTAARLGRTLRLILGYLRLRRQLGAQGDEVLALLKDPAAALRDPTSPFMRRTTWDAATVDSVLARLDLIANGQPDRGALRGIGNLQRVHEVLQPVTALRAPYALLVASITNNPADPDVRALYSALRSRYAAADWATLMKPINDRVRARRRDALVAAVLHALHTDADPIRRTIDTPDRLYEYLLLDAQMHPRVETSRIRQALASVQQFIQRCVEIPGSEAADIHVPLAMREQWPWMKRYRIWEANRKVFLYPENWLEPELRDDQSPIFRETLGELLQGDITEERAAEAMISYLRKLEQVAQLEPAGMHLDTRETSATIDDVLHVIARSAGANRKYFYRQRTLDGWMPWESIKLDVEDNPVLPLRWKNRLFLFWVKIIQEANIAGTPMFTDPSQALANQPASQVPLDAPTHTVKAILCWSEYVNGKWTDSRTSSPGNAAVVGANFTAMGGSNNPFVRDQYRLFASIQDDQLDVFFGLEPSGDRFSASCWFRLFNSFAEPDVLPVHHKARIPNPFGESIDVSWQEGFNLRRLLHASKEALVATYYAAGTSAGNHALLRRADEKRGAWCVPRHNASEAWHDSAPFFYWDSRHTFFITPTLFVLPDQAWKWTGPFAAKPDASQVTVVRYESSEMVAANATTHVLPASTIFELDGERIDSRGVVVNRSARS
jgi:ABC toxin-like protein/neuraminidase-like protein